MVFFLPSKHDLTVYDSTTVQVKNQKSSPEQTMGVFDYVLKQNTEMHTLYTVCQFWFLWNPDQVA